jgi:hypothetical protein
MGSRHLRPTTARTTASFAPRPALQPCPMGAAARDVCMQDPNRLAHWPDICRTCNEKTRRTLGA